MLEEFKKFIQRGNVIDLAVGIIIGGAFQKIVTSLVEDIITPIISIPLGKMDFSHLTAQIGEATITYGNFITAVIDFLIMAFVIFMIVKSMNKFNNTLHAKTSILDEKAKKIAEKAAKKAAKLARKNGQPAPDAVSAEETQTTQVEEPTTKICPFCYTEINYKATRCPHCTSVLDEKKHSEE